MPAVLEDLFRSTGRSLTDYLNVQPLETICRYHYPSGRVFDAPNSRQGFINAVESAFGEGQAVRQYLDRAETMYDISSKVFLGRPFESWRTMASGGAMETMSSVKAIDPLRKAATVHDQMFKSPELKQLFNRYATYTGSSPYSVPATLNVIPYVELCLGGFYIPGGMYQIGLALARLCEEFAIETRYGVEVSRIEHEKGRVHTVVLESGEKLSFDAVVANSDVVYTYERLLSPAPLKRHVLRRMEPSCSGLVFLWGVKGQSGLSYHNIFFSSDYRSEFEALFKRRTISDDPTVYVTVGSQLTPSDAPVGYESWFVLINAPYLPHDEKDQPELWRRTRENVLDKLARMGIDIRSRIEFEHTVTPHDLLRKTSSNRGSIYGLSSNGIFSALHRQPNRATGFSNLYFAGGSVHPGGGIPLTLLSGQHAASMALADLGVGAGRVAAVQAW
jgi:phytoene desaturase